MAGDKKSQEICFNLTQKASKPYLKSLDDWLMNGVINDPFDEVNTFIISLNGLFILLFF
jgi:Gamma tubulin complex component N-terminal